MKKDSTSFRLRCRAIVPPVVTLLVRPDRFEEQHQELRPLMIRSLTRRGMSEEEAEDLVQEAWLRLLRFPPQGCPLRQAAFRALELARIEAWRKKGITTEPLPEEAFSEVPGIERVEVDDLIASIRKKLSPEESETLTFLGQGCTYAEMSVQLGVSERQIQRRVARIRLVAGELG